MSFVRFSCNDCRHNEVCKYRDDYKKAVESVKKIEIADNFSVEVNCKYYRSEQNSFLRNQYMV